VAVPAEFTGKVALITGVGRVGQVGHAIAESFGRAGARLVIADVNGEALAARVDEFTAQGFAVRGAAGNLTQPEAARAAVDTARASFGGLDVVINVAGGLLNYGSALDIRVDAFQRELAVNLTTTWCVSQAAIPSLVERGGGAIVNFASVAVLTPQSQMAAYSAAKSAVAGLTRALAHEFRDRHVRVNAVAPGTLRTADNVAQMGEKGARFVELSDLVDAVLFLASDAARAISGIVLPVTGGEG